MRGAALSSRSPRRSTGTEPWGCQATFFGRVCPTTVPLLRSAFGAPKLPLMAEARWSYMLRIMKRNPDRIPMDRLAEYMRLFAELLGSENRPVFKGIKKASTGLKAQLNDDRLVHVQARLRLVRAEPESRPARCAEALEAFLGEDGIAEAQLLDSGSNVVHLFHGLAAVDDEIDRVYQEGTVDGVVTGLVGADDTMHLHLRSINAQDLKLVVRDEDLARDILSYFRKGILRVSVQGHWLRSVDGWHPEANRCTVRSFVPLDERPASEVFRELAEVPDNGWKAMERPEAFWDEIRGIH